MALRTRRGFTLIEVMIAMVLLTIVFIGTARFTMLLLKNVRTSRVKTVATEVATDQIQSVKTDVDYDNLSAHWAGTTVGFSTRGFVNMKRQTIVTRARDTVPPVTWDHTTVTVRVSDPSMPDTVALTYMVAAP